MESKMQNRLAQRDSGISIFERLSGLLCWPHGRVFKASPAQRDSGIYNLGMEVIRVMGVMGMIRQNHKIKNTFPQRNFKMSNFKTSPYCPSCPLVFENRYTQLDSGISIFGRLSGALCWPHGHKIENSSAQLDSRMSNLGMGLMGPMGPIRLMGPKCVPAQRDSGISKLRVGVMRILRSLGWKIKSKNRPAQRDFGISILKVEIETSPAQADSEISILKTSPYCPYLPLAFKNIPAQRHSKMSNGRLSGVLCRPHGGRLSGVLCWPHRHKIENSLAQRDSRMSNLGMGLMRSIGLIGRKCVPAQRDSGISNLKVETETSLAQRDSGISNLKVETETIPAQRDSGISNLGLSPFEQEKTM